MSDALKKVNTKRTSQTERAKPEQVKNNAGGYVFKVNDAQRIRRFLVLGTDGGTYYTGQQDLTAQNVDFLRKALAKDASAVLKETVEVSQGGLAKSNSPAIFVLALALNTDGVDKAKVQEDVQKVVRTGTHLFEFMTYLENLGGWGRSKRVAVSDWYTSKTPDQVAYQAVKYRNRHGFTHRDALRLCHVKGLDVNVGNFILGKPHEATGVIAGFEAAQKAASVKELLSVLEEYKNLPWEAVPTSFHNKPELWKTLCANGALGQTAMLRNVVRMTKIGAFDDTVFAAGVAKDLADTDRIAKGKVHPISYLNALLTYKEGQVERGGYSLSRKKDWTVNHKVAKALEDGFYNAFKTLTPANKRTMVAVDVSASMGAKANGLDMSCSQVSAAVAMTIARTEPYSEIRGFSHKFVDLGIGDHVTLTQAMSRVRGLTFGSTDCSLPMQWALKSKVEVDTFVVITDNETWSGRIHPHQALKEYRQKTGIDARLAVLGVSATEFTIADPSDSGMMDFVGFDSGAPSMLANFSAGRV